MRLRAFASAVTITTCILIVGWQLGTSTSDAATTTAQDRDGRDEGRMSPAFADRSGRPGRAGGDGRGSRFEAAAAPAPSTALGASDGTFFGPPIPYPRGSVAVGVTVADGVITDVEASLVAQNPVSRDINGQVAPLLRNAVLITQTSDITMISGATYTSEAYAASLQAALDEATP
jgi:uncharacterized protein with FMN-binding domain